MYDGLNSVKYWGNNMSCITSKFWLKSKTFLFERYADHFLTYLADIQRDSGIPAGDTIRSRD